MRRRGADAVTLTILEDANPDGRAAATRDNANGVDINRNFPASNFDATNPTCGGSPLSQPEARALYDTIERTDPDLILVAHSWPDRQFVNFDGPARTIAERFAASSGLTVAESSSFAPTTGSLGSYVGRGLGTPILTIELRKGSDPKADWERIHAALPPGDRWLNARPTPTRLTWGLHEANSPQICPERGIDIRDTQPPSIRIANCPGRDVSQVRLKSSRLNCRLEHL